MDMWRAFLTVGNSVMPWIDTEPNERDGFKFISALLYNSLR